MSHPLKSLLENRTESATGGGLADVPSRPPATVQPPPAEGWRMSPSRPPATVQPPPPGRESASSKTLSAPSLDLPPGWAVDAVDAVDPPAPCPVCGSMELWLDMLGRYRCQHCEANQFRRAMRWAVRAAQLRQIKQVREQNQNQHTAAYEEDWK